jgi:hypothetical protein
MGSKLEGGYVYKRSDRADRLGKEFMRATPEDYARWAAERADGDGAV